MTIAESLKRFREKFGLNIRNVSIAAGINPASYAYEEGITRRGEKVLSIPNAEIIKNIAKFYQVSTDYLLGLTDDPRPVNQILAESAAPQKELTLEILQAEIKALKARVEVLEKKI